MRNVSEGLLCRVGSTSKISPESYPLVTLSSSVATTESTGEQIFITMTTVARSSNTEEGQVPVFQKLDNTTHLATVAQT